MMRNPLQYHEIGLFNGQFFFYKDAAQQPVSQMLGRPQPIDLCHL
ncbi:MAG: hypothetical protein ABFD51_00555 [Anaerolineaceae bacterium]